MTVVREVWRYRELVRQLVRRDLVERYQRSVVGVVLAIAMPVLVCLVLSLVFRRMADPTIRSDWMHFLWVLLGYLSWDHFSRSLAIAVDGLKGHAHLIGRVAFPLEVLPLSTVLSVLVHLAVGLGLFLVVSGAAGGGVHATWLWLPVLLLVQLVWTTGAALLVAPLGVLLADFGHLLQIAISLLFFGSGIFYAVSQAPAGVATAIWWNPTYQLAEAWRRALLDGEAPWTAGFAWLVAASAATLACGNAFFRRMRFAVTEELG